jgi:hypothetical protein
MPITNDVCPEFLREEEAMFLQVLIAAAADRRPANADNDDEEEEVAGQQMPAWCIYHPFLHLYCCLVLYEVK